jgi:hypothetical protein
MAKMRNCRGVLSIESLTRHLISKAFTQIFPTNTFVPILLLMNFYIRFRYQYTSR